MVEDVRLELLFLLPKQECKPLHFILHMEPVTGIGPAYPAWKAGVLPLNYTDILSAPGEWWAALPAQAAFVLRRVTREGLVVLPGLEPGYSRL